MAHDSMLCCFFTGPGAETAEWMLVDSGIKDNLNGVIYAKDLYVAWATLARSSSPGRPYLTKSNSGQT
jgi:hypothetical protein